MKSQNLIEKRLVQNLLRLEICAIEAKENPQIANYCHGFRKGTSLLNMENSIKSYFKVLNIIQRLKKTKKPILFIGSPFGFEKKIKSFFPKLQIFLSLKEFFEEVFFSSILIKTRAHFVIAFCDRVCPLFNDCFIKSIPVVCFTLEVNNTTFLDYPVLINIRSKGCIGLFLYLLGKSS